MTGKGQCWPAYRRVMMDPASSSTGSYNESAYWVYPLDVAQLVSGTNTVAIEVHQHAGSSSDLVLDAYIEVETVDD